MSTIFLFTLPRLSSASCTTWTPPKATRPMHPPISSVCTAFSEVVAKSESYRSMHIQNEWFQSPGSKESVRWTMDDERGEYQSSWRRIMRKRLNRLQLLKITEHAGYLIESSLRTGRWTDLINLVNRSSPRSKSPNSRNLLTSTRRNCNNGIKVCKKCSRSHWMAT